MKLFIAAALIAAVSAARLEHLERGYLPPAQNNYAANAGGSSFPTAAAHGSFGLSNQGSQYSAPNRGSNGFGVSNDYASNGAGSNGFGAYAGQGANGFGKNGGRGSNGFGGNYGSNGASGRNGGFQLATSNQYLPPNYGAAGSNGGSNFGSSIRPSCTSCGSSTFGSQQRYQPQSNTFGSQGVSIPSTQYGSPQSFVPSSSFESQQSYTAQRDEPAAASRQYLAPKSSSAQNAPQQPFDENTGYIY